MSTSQPPTPPARHPLNDDRPPLWPFFSVFLNFALAVALIAKLPDTTDPRSVTGRLVTQALNTENEAQHSAIVTAVVEHITTNKELVVTTVEISPDLLQADCPPATPESYFGQPSGEPYYYSLPLAQDPPFAQEAIPGFSDYVMPPGASVNVPAITGMPTNEIYWLENPPGWHTIAGDTEVNFDRMLDELPRDTGLEPLDADDLGSPDEELWVEPQASSPVRGRQFGPKP